MRFVFLVPDLDTHITWQVADRILHRIPSPALHHWLRHRLMRVNIAHGGTLNLMRHCQTARSCGVEAVLATMRGRDTYGERGIADLPFIRWDDRRPDDICIVPDYVTALINEVEGPAIAYLQAPIFVKANFDYKSDRVQLWTDSPFMQAICEQAYPGKPVPIVPNIVDNTAFPFIAQRDREAGLVFAFPRKGPEFIDATEECYQRLGGQFWRFERIDGLSFRELAQQFRRPQVFLASAEVEGCALPPQESMAAGIVVVGKTARGANFCMQHRETAMTAETPEAAAKCLIDLEDEALRSHIAQQAHQYISRYFPDREPRRFWQETIAHYSGRSVAAIHQSV